MSIIIENEPPPIGRPPTAGCAPLAKEVSEKVAAWAAGFLEGRGSFMSTSTGARLSLQMRASEIAALQRMKKYFGGTISPINAGKRVRWVLCGSRIFDMLRHVSTYLTKSRRIFINQQVRGMAPFREGNK